MVIMKRNLSMNKQPLRRILICEDDTVTAHLLQGILQPYGEVVLATNGQTGWDLYARALAERTPFSLCCLDIHMPVLDGYALLERIRAEESTRELASHERVRILMITSVDDTDGFLHAATRGVDGYLVKPIDPEALREALWDVGIVQTR